MPELHDQVELAPAQIGAIQNYTIYHVNDVCMKESALRSSVYFGTRIEINQGTCVHLNLLHCLR